MAGQQYVTDANALVRNLDGSTSPVSQSKWATPQADGSYLVDSGFQFATMDGGTVGVADYGFASPYTQQEKPQQQDTTAADAQAHLQGVLDQFGLGSLSSWAYGLLTQGYGEAYILQELRNRPEFNDRFPAIAQRRAAGLPPVSPADYVNLEKSYDAYLQQAGLTGMIDRKSNYTKWIAGDVSPVEVKARADEAYQAAMGEPIEVRNELTRLFGVQAGGAAIAYFLDPTNALPKLKQVLQSGEVAGGALRSSYGLLTADEASHLAQLGVTGDQAQQGFGSLAHQSQLFNALPGENGTAVTQGQQIAAQFEGNTQIQDQIRRTAEGRVATFAGADGGYRVGQTGANSSGVGGLGSSST